MDLSTLCCELMVRDLQLQLKGTKLVCTGPEVPSPEIRAAIRQHKDELLRQLLENARAQAQAPESVGGEAGPNAPEPEPSAWVEIFSKNYSAAAADLYRRSVPFSAETTSDRCMTCDGTRWWRLRAGCPWVCARCHPTNLAEAKVEWREGGPPVLGTDPNATPPSASLAPTLNPEVAHG